MDIKTHLSAALKAKRKEKGYTQEMVGVVLGLTRVAIINIERGNNTTTLSSLYKLSCLFECSPSDFFPPIEPLPMEFEEIEIITVKKKLVPKRLNNDIQTNGASPMQPNSSTSPDNQKT